MNHVRMSVLDGTGGVSFVVHADALPACVAACSRSPYTIDDFLRAADANFGGLRERVLNGLAIFDERNVEGRFAAIHRAIEFCEPHELPPFRIVDERTREASLTPAGVGAILFNLPQKRIVQIHNSFRQLSRIGRAPIFDGQSHTGRFFSYKLPNEWAIVP